MINLKIYPQTALLFLIDALRSTEKAYKLELYLDSGAIGGALFELNSTLAEGKLLFAENELQVLMSKFMALLQQGEQGSAQTESPSVAAVELPADSDSTGVK